MWMDADDVLEETEKEKFLQLKQSLSPDTDIVMMKYHTAFDEAGVPSFSYFRERWIRNSSRYRWVGAVHEVITPNGKVLYSDIAICHRKMGAGDPDRNLRIYWKREKSWSRGSNIIMGGNYTITGNMRKLSLCLNSFCSPRMGGLKIR